jgi:cytoskeletal protein CcmA (bactofilin family)
MARPMMSVFGQFNQRGRSVASDEAMASRESAALLHPVEESRKPAKQQVTTLGKTLSFKGTLFADEDMVVLGRVEGAIEHTGNLQIGVGGVVAGDVTAKTVTIKGTVEGDIEASDSVLVALGAVVKGDIKAPRISIVEGAEFNGAIVMVKKPQSMPESTEVLGDGDVLQLLSGG